MRQQTTKITGVIIKYLPVLFILLVHLFVLFLLYLTDSVKSTTKIDSQNREYEQCEYSKISILR